MWAPKSASVKTATAMEWIFLRSTNLQQFPAGFD
jgi:hypothetical protein